MKRITDGIRFNYYGIHIYAMTSITVLAILFIILFPSSVQSQEQGSIIHLTDTQISLGIDNITVGDSPTGLIFVKGTVHNNSTENIVNVKVKVDLFDTNDTVITETIRFITPPSSIFKPGYESDFDFLVTAKSVDHYTITAYGDMAQ